MAAGRCPVCDSVITAENAVKTVFVRDLALTRDVDWAVLIHGMNTAGAWQEEVSWLFGTTWGRSIPVAVYKYGIVRVGVILPWRRRAMLRELRGRIAELTRQARAQGYEDPPDLIAHSFGTWLTGHLLLDELAGTSDDRLCFGRIILTGCVLRPDFDWAAVKEAGLVREVLNHYATADPIVPLAHWTIWDSGPSGRRGFDGGQTIDIAAHGYGHSDLFSIDRCVVDGEHGRPCPDDATAIRNLDHAYESVWRPFLTLPTDELDVLPGIEPPEDPWHAAPLLLRGVLFPVFVVPLALALLVLLISWVGGLAAPIMEPAARIAGVFGVGLGATLLGVGAVLGWRRLRRGKTSR
jgi:hypothetical protein